MRTVGRVAMASLSALLGLALCIGAIRVDEALHLLPRLPTPGGEDDFSVRAGLFFGVTCPAFALLGGYLGWIGAALVGRAARAWAGAILGTAVCFGLAAAFPSALVGLARTSLGGNGAFAAFLALWLALSASLAVLLGRQRN